MNRPKGVDSAIVLFEARGDELVPFRRVKAGPDLYEKEIEELLWHNLEAFVGEPLFPVARQASVGGGLRPDIVALDREGYVHVIEVKRHVDRSQLAQCLEYAGWARDVSLDDLAGMFHDGPEIFFSAWSEFTDTDAPRLARRPPRLILAAGGFDTRTDAALGYLTESDLSIARATVLPDGRIRLENGRPFASPSRAAKDAAGIEAYAGWRAWHLEDGRSLGDLRKQLLDQQRQSA